MWSQWWSVGAWKTCIDSQTDEANFLIRQSGCIWKREGEAGQNNKYCNTGSSQQQETRSLYYTIYTVNILCNVTGKWLHFFSNLMMCFLSIEFEIASFFVSFFSISSSSHPFSFSCTHPSHPHFFSFFVISMLYLTHFHSFFSPILLFSTLPLIVSLLFYTPFFFSFPLWQPSPVPVARVTRQWAR